MRSATSHTVGNTRRTLLTVTLLLACQLSLGAEPRRLQVSASVIERTATGQSVDVLVLLDDAAEKRALAPLLPASGQPGELRGAAYGRYISERARLLRDLKRGVMNALPNRDIQSLSNYDVLPVMHLRLANAMALENLQAHNRVLSIDEIREIQPMQTESLPLINQPTAQAAGRTGAGTTVCMLDSGTDYTRAVFGTCSTPGATGCKVAAAVDIAPNDGQLDDPAIGMHGTNVAGIVLGVAPGARVATVDVFTGGSGTSNDMLGGINWCIANRATYNIVAINMSLGSGRYYSAVNPVDSIGTAIQTASGSGIVTVVASGNNGYTDSLAWPAAYSNVVSVGAVYDASLGPMTYGMCSDLTAADKVSCFSNSASFLTLLAPGSSIVAAGLTRSGTSQAAPHVAGAVAVMAAAYPAENSAARVTRLTRGVDVTDTRNGIIRARLDLVAALANTSPAPQPLPTYGNCATTDCREGYGGWRVRSGLR